ncbi:MAG TPA: hypothetical protein VNY05_34630 [Candidatus Acidoferrales bacterium]|nr:hypothetical protein [Candidatus Acidoferrales bacterium]
MSSRVSNTGILACVVLACALPPARAQIYASNLPSDHAAILYQSAALDDAATRLGKQLASGKTRLAFREGGFGYLPGLLEYFGINPDTQALVFSQTSFQASKISPRNPRAIYFNDEVAVGWVRGGEGIEVAALDPTQGIVFYSLTGGTLARRQECLHCHIGSATLGVPGMFVGSVYPNAFGRPDRTGAIITDHRTPFSDRWGGWYVNAARGQQRDRANATAPDPAEPHALMTEGKQNLASLTREFNTAGYLSPVSDIVALMTFEHQTQMVNFFTRLGWEARIAEHDRKHDPQPDRQLEADIESAIQGTVAYMLFVDEAPLQEPVEGISTFTRTFPQRGPRDRQGRSLRDFDLQTRLFRYPLSYMVYSRAFDALPEGVRARIYRRLYDVLSGKERSAKFARISGSDRRAILEILGETKPRLPAYWKDHV